MELEELKQKYDLLSAELEKQNITTCNALNSVANKREKTLIGYSYITLLCNFAVIPLLFYFYTKFATPLSATIFLICFLFIDVIWEITHIIRLKRIDLQMMSTILIEKNIVNYRKSLVIEYVFVSLAAIVMILWILLGYYDLIIKYQRGWLAISVLFFVIAAILFESRWKLGFIKEWVKTVKDYKEFVNN